MSRITRAAVATAVAAALSLGLTAPASFAAPKADGGKSEHRQVKTHKASKSEKSRTRGAKTDKATRKVAQGQRTVSREAARKEAYLVRLLSSSKLEGLEDGIETALRASIETDLGDLAALDTAASSAATPQDVRAVLAQVRLVRPEVYNTIINQVRRAEDLVLAAADVPEVMAAVEAALTLLATYDAQTARSDLRAVQKLLSDAAELLEAEDPELTEGPTTGEPTTEGPTTEGPTTEGPTTGDDADGTV